MPPFRAPRSDRKSCSRSCGICRNRGTPRPLVLRLRGGRQSKGVPPRPNSPSTASTPPACKKAKSVTHVSGTKCHLCLRPLSSFSKHHPDSFPDRNEHLLSLALIALRD